jgi:hypothetical protein
MEYACTGDTMTPEQREAALRLADWLRSSGVVNAEVRETEALLRELAAEPVPEWPCTCDEQGIGKPGVTCGDCPRDYGHKAAEPVQEPVAEVIDCGRGNPFALRELDWCPSDLDRLPAGTKLYAAPQQRKPLTEDFINDLGFQCGLQREDARNPGVEEFARAIERAHGIGEQE